MVHLQRGIKHETGNKSWRAILSVDARSIRATTGHGLRHPITVLLRVRQQEKKKKKEGIGVKSGLFPCGWQQGCGIWLLEGFDYCGMSDSQRSKSEMLGPVASNTTNQMVAKPRTSRCGVS